MSRVFWIKLFSKCYSSFVRPIYPSIISFCYSVPNSCKIGQLNLRKALQLLYSLYCQSRIQRNPVESNSGEPPKCDHSPALAHACNSRQQEAKRPAYVYSKNIVNINPDCLSFKCAGPKHGAVQCLIEK